MLPFFYLWFLAYVMDGYIPNTFFIMNLSKHISIIFQCKTFIYIHTHTHTHTELEGLRGLHLILYLLILFNSHLLSKPWFNILEMLNLANSLYAFY